jgi:hypothetical protein
MKRCSLVFLGFFFLTLITQAQETKKSLLCDLVTQKHQNIKIFYKADLFKENTRYQINKGKDFLSKKTGLFLDKQAATKIFFE